MYKGKKEEGDWDRAAFFRSSAFGGEGAEEVVRGRERDRKEGRKEEAVRRSNGERGREGGRGLKEREREQEKNREREEQLKNFFEGN